MRREQKIFGTLALLVLGPKIIRAIDVHGLLRRIERQADAADPRREADAFHIRNLEDLVVSVGIIGKAITMAVGAFGLGIIR